MKDENDTKEMKLGSKRKKSKIKRLATLSQSKRISH